MRTLAFLAAVGLVGLALASQAEAVAAKPVTASVYTPIIASILGGDTAAVQGSDGRYYVVYEIIFTNAKRVPAAIERVEVTDADTGEPVRILKGASLVESLRNLNVDPVDDASLASSESRLCLITLAFDGADEVPSHLTHRLFAQAASNPGARAPTPVRYDVAPLDVSRRSPPVLRPPLRGPGWLAVNGCCEESGVHRGAVQTVNGKLWDSQRFAIDWMRLDDQGRLFDGPKSKLEGYSGYGAPVYAAAAGVVVQAQDGLDDQKPGALPDPTTITLDTVDGNHVVIDHGGGVHTFYAHLKKGSVRVRQGEKVEAGQELASIGNTGNTSAPHLHFHVMTGVSPLGSDGIPFVYDSFSTTERIGEPAFDAALDGSPLPPAAGTPHAHANEIPLDLTVSTFQ